MTMHVHYTPIYDDSPVKPVPDRYYTVASSVMHGGGSALLGLVSRFYEVNHREDEYNFAHVMPHTGGEVIVGTMLGSDIERFVDFLTHRKVMVGISRLFTLSFIGIGEFDAGSITVFPSVPHDDKPFTIPHFVGGFLDDGGTPAQIIRSPMFDYDDGFAL